MTAKAMVLAAGRGKRLRPLTDHTPKPMVILAGKPMIEYQLEGLKRAGFTDVVVNVAWLGQKIIDGLGDGSRFGLRLQYSNEGETGLETGGGIRKALPYLSDSPFIVTNGDVYTDFDYKTLRSRAESLPTEVEAYLVLVPNPPAKAQGDFGLLAGQVVDEPQYTFSGIGIYRPGMLKAVNKETFSLAPVLREAIARGAVKGELWQGRWADCGTPESLAALDAELKRQSQDNLSSPHE